ncbi:hypothetical protein BC829DRAFT_156156 [Chytridium lagenaria]|nr:hypothetical protein BC829DRAFT_156156 [Chytridium lagenaria]
MRAGVTSKFLDEYTREGLFEGFASMAKGLRKAGYSNIVFQMDVSDPFVHRSTLSDVKLLTKSKPFTSLTSSANACVIELDTNPTTGKVSFGAVAPHPKFEVSDSNFLMDVFVRRKKMQSHDIKGYQDLVQNSIEWTQDTTPILPITSPPSPTFRPVARPTPPSTPTQRRFHLSLPAARRVREFLDTQFPAPCNTTIIEWTCMQNPLATFKRPPLPGQKFPGLGCGKEFLAAVVHLASVRRRDAVATVPDHFHNAWMYGKSGYEFVSPAFAGYFMAIMDDLKDDIRKHGIAAISWAFHNGHVVDKEGVVEVWQPQDQMTPISRRMRAYFRSHGYKHLVEEFRETFKGRLMSNGRMRWS